MKVHIDITIDDDIARFLQEENNKSNLINELLKAHYNAGNIESLSIMKQKQAESKIKLKELRFFLRENAKKIAIFEDREAKILNIFKELDKKQRSILENCEKINVIWWQSMKKEFEGFSFLQILQIHNNLKGVQNVVGK